MTVHDQNKATVAALRSALASCDAAQAKAAIIEGFAPDARIRLGHPFQDVDGPNDLWDRVYAQLFAAMPDLERRDFIVMAGPRWGVGQTGNWVGLGGNFVGTLSHDWLGIPASHTPVFMRYQEYLRFDNGRIVEMEGLWDIPQLMQQAGVWPMAPQRGVEWMCPGPADGQGTIATPFDDAQADASVQLVWNMLHELKQGTAETPERGLGGYWHNHALWYGPTGLGSARGHNSIANLIFRQFREGLSDNIRHLDEGVFFGDRNLVAFTGWPSGTATHSGDGFLSLAPTGRRIERRSLDFWRVENGQVRECWVMVDMLDLYRQLGVDILGRLHSMPIERKVA
ncbi:ester cyclase [Roseivivax sp. THAF197b]|uniref:ester cyclase n=1 Tax=Roseivivax sp. THAF197b TaxID=2588299 RepID=UPI001268B6A5|nr:ester cyclase [Roseivivax sp. THAF197b]QFS81217.1 SnoaL-like polyketide cyclase [Roseivivax sp. THAF197b]